jgi:vitamin B12 transporter
MKPVLSLLALAAATPAVAQSDPAALPADPGGGEVVVTASRSGEGVAIRDLPASVTLLGPGDLEERQTRLVADTLRDVPGVAVNRTAGGLGDVRIRGTEANHVLVLIDGIEASDPFLGQFDFSTLLADDGARVEVLRGQQSSLYGSDAIGGVVHYITATGREQPGLSLRAEGGTRDTVAGGARFGGASDTLDYALSATGYRSGGFPTARGGVRDIGATFANATAKLTWSPTAAFRLTGVGRYAWSRSEVNASENDPASPSFGLTVDSPGNFYRNRAVYGLLRGELALSDRWTAAVGGQIADTRRRGFVAGARDSGDSGRRYKATAETSLRLGDDRIAHRLTGAVDWERETFANTTPSDFVFRGRRATENVGLVAQYEVTVADALSAGASVRRDENTRFADATTWRVQAGYRLASGLRVRGAYGTGVKNPGYYELYGFSDGRYIGNPDLRPEKSAGWEAGVDWNLADGRATLGATWFDSRLTGEIFTTYPPPDFVATPANRTTRSRQHGIEAFVSARPIRALKFDLAYTWTDATEAGADEVRRPHHVASANATVFGPDERFSGTLTVRYNGRQRDVTFTDPTYATTPIVLLQEFVLVNLAADYRLNDRLSLFGRVENLFDERYEEVFSFAGAGRSAVGGLRARF